MKNIFLCFLLTIKQTHNIKYWTEFFNVDLLTARRDL